jgi:hypothetical protein
MASMRRGALLLVTVVALLLSAAGDARADRATEMKAREAFAAGRFDQALDLFARLYAETLHPVYLRNIGRCHQKMREPQKAIDAFRDYLTKEKKMTADERAEINGYITEMEALKAEQAKQAQPTPVQPVTPIAPAVTTPPPATAPPPAVSPAPSPSTTLVAQPGPPPESEGSIFSKPVFWIIVGAAVIGGVVAAVVLTSGGTDRPPCTADSCM